MRVLTALVALSLLAPLVGAEFGSEFNGYPVGEGGVLHDPAVAMDSAALLELQARFAQDYPALNKVGPATLYPYYPILVAEVERLAMDHPDKVRVQVGQSTLGLEIFYLEIANWADEGTDAFLPLEEREVVMIDGGTHSNEYSGVYFVLALAQYLLDGSPEDEFAQWVLENRHTIITPMVNPDGSNAMGRLNAQAVNINRNFPVLWGGEGTDMLLNNPGPSAMSEVETTLVVDRVEHYQPDYHLSVHCCGNLWLFPYGEDGYDPLDVDLMNHICDVAFPVEIRTDCGPIWSTIYPASGSTADTVYEYTGAVAFGFEMSGRSNLVGIWGEPITYAEVAEQEVESWDAAMHAFENVHLYGGFPVIEDVAASGTALGITIRNDGYGPLNATVRMADAEASFVNLGPGNVTQVVVPGKLADADAVVVEYQKRIMASPTGTLNLAVQVSDTGMQLGGLEVRKAGAELLNSTDANVPALPLAALLVGLSLVVRRAGRP